MVTSCQYCNVGGQPYRILDDEPYDEKQCIIAFSTFITKNNYKINEKDKTVLGCKFVQEIAQNPVSKHNFNCSGQAWTDNWIMNHFVDTMFITDDDKRINDNILTVLLEEYEKTNKIKRNVDRKQIVGILHEELEKQIPKIKFYISNNKLYPKQSAQFIQSVIRKHHNTIHNCGHGCLYYESKAAIPLDTSILEVLIDNILLNLIKVNYRDCQLNIAGAKKFKQNIIDQLFTEVDWMSHVYHTHYFHEFRTEVNVLFSRYIMKNLKIDLQKRVISFF